jgi:hypothetical protein
LANKDERHLLDELAKTLPSDLASIEFPLHILLPHLQDAKCSQREAAIKKRRRKPSRALRWGRT